MSRPLSDRELDYEDLWRRYPQGWQEPGRYMTYFIRCSVTGRIKIGESTNVERRLVALQTCSPTLLELVAAMKRSVGWTETSVHRLFEADRLHGEWFEPSQRLHAFIESFASVRGPGWPHLRWPP